MSPNLWWWMTIHSSKLEIVWKKWSKRLIFQTANELKEASSWQGRRSNRTCSQGYLQHWPELSMLLLTYTWTIFCVGFRPMLQKKDGAGRHRLDGFMEVFLRLPYLQWQTWKQTHTSVVIFCTKNVNILLSIKTNISQIDNLILVRFWLILFAKRKKLHWHNCAASLIWHLN